MLKHLKRWLGWESEPDLRDPAGASPRVQSAPLAPKPAGALQTRSIEQPPKPPTTERDVLDVLDNPRLSLDKPPDDGFDPYNTGAFNRSASWERIGRQRKR
jgi:hypothetical protein